MEPFMKQAMRLIFSISNFALTMILALLVFTFTAIQFPAAMRALLTTVKDIRDVIADQHLADGYMVWVDIFLQPSLIVLTIFGVTVRLGIEIIGAIFNGWRFPNEADAAAPAVLAPIPPPSPFTRWE
jgi:hypothetical protein